VGRAGAAALVLAGLLAMAAGTALLLIEGRVPAPPPDDPAPVAAVAAVAAVPPPPAPPPPVVPVVVAPPPVVEPEEEDDGWREYPEGAKGPVVVGIVRAYADPDPECWVALESTADPARPDPSTVETLERGRFRLTGMAPGKYRVRVKGDEMLPTYSAEIEVRDGHVTDAGTLRLNRRGYLSGVLKDAEGTEVRGEVRVFGRDPATLETRVVESVPCLGRQGFQAPAHEAGEYVLAATADAGFAIHRGKTDGDGLAWAEIRLRPWASLDADLAPAKEGGPKVRAVRVALESVAVPDLGIPAPGGNRGAPARFERLPPGTYRVTATWDEHDGTEWRPRKATREALVAEGAAERVAVPR
jgi:hypothetical protein